MTSEVWNGRCSRRVSCFEVIEEGGREGAVLCFPSVIFMDCRLAFSLLSLSLSDQLTQVYCFPPFLAATAFSSLLHEELWHATCFSGLRTSTTCRHSTKFEARGIHWKLRNKHTTKVVLSMHAYNLNLEALGAGLYAYRDELYDELKRIQFL